MSLAEATDAAKKLLLLMDTDKSGKVSKQEWMRFMRKRSSTVCDTNHDGQLDVKELTQSQMRSANPLSLHPVTSRTLTQVSSCHLPRNQPAAHQ